jgi:hypothetical protein
VSNGIGHAAHPLHSVGFDAISEPSAGRRRPLPRDHGKRAEIGRLITDNGVQTSVAKPVSLATLLEGLQTRGLAYCECQVRNEFTARGGLLVSRALLEDRGLAEALLKNVLPPRHTSRDSRAPSQYSVRHLRPSDSDEV